MSHPYVTIATSLQNPHRTSNIKPNSSMIAMTGTPRACPMAAFSGFYESPGPPPLGDVRGIVPPHCNDHQNGHQSGYIIHRCFICCRPGGRRGNTERVVAQWQRPVASGKPWSCCIGRCALYGTGAPPWPSKWPSRKWVHITLLLLFCLLLPWRLPK